MGNEAKTENLVREYLRGKGYYDNTDITVEEKKSDIPQISKLLKHASKEGMGPGYPEFIITSKNNSNFIIVTECKADTTNHVSKTLDHYADYAVDGVRLYSSYLSKECDVIGIAVSGEDKNNLLVDTFLQIKGEKQARDLGIHQVNDFNSYIGIVDKDTIKEEADFKKLMGFSTLLNKTLRDSFEFEENQRALTVSGILLALEDQGFCSSYEKKRKPLEVANLLVTTIKERLERENIGGFRKDSIINTYNFFKTNTNIVTEKNKDGTPNMSFTDLIKSIESNVKPFLRNHKHYDVIGQFYNEFLRYANGDGGLGVVLTPKHITELFSELAEVNKDSVALDNCCGTGGFLISAMKKMEDGAKGDSAKIGSIHKNQLVGIESNAKMFCLACSNMMLRGDGKSNIHQRDCFVIDDEEVTKFKPTVGFLNPPYAKKKELLNELAFIENCLGFLQPNGICIAIIPQSCVMNTKKVYVNYKKRLLQSHTLRAVMSMPNTLFDDCNTSAVTCVLVFEAHKPHNSQIGTWFGYWKDDGFIKVRPSGRSDYYGKYQSHIKKYWLDTYFNKKEIDGYSILRSIRWDDEWLVEPYIKTKFEDLRDGDFESTLREYATFLFYNKIKAKVSKSSYGDTKYMLNFNNWKPIALKQLFKVSGSLRTDKKVLDNEYGAGGYPYVTTQSVNNGVRGFYNYFSNKGNVLTIDSATIGYCSYQPLEYSASDHVEKLTPLNFKLNVFRAMFLITVINMEQYRYSYGRKFNQNRIRETIVKLPHKNDNEIDWEFIENYIKGLNYSKDIELGNDK